MLAGLNLRMPSNETSIIALTEIWLAPSAVDTEIFFWADRDQTHCGDGVAL